MRSPQTVTLTEELWQIVKRELGKRHRLASQLQDLIEDAMTWGESTAEAGEYGLDEADVLELYQATMALWPLPLNH